MTVDVDVVELVWTLISVIGFALALDALFVAMGDHELVRQDRARGSEGRYAKTLELALTAGDVAGARWIVTIELANATVGVLAMLQPDLPGGRSPLGWAIVSMLILAGAALPLRLIGQRQRRRRLVRSAP